MEVDPCFTPPSFEAEQAHHCLSLPPLDSVHCLHGPGPVFTPEREDGIHMVHQSSTLDLPRHIGALVDLTVPPIVGRLHSFPIASRVFPCLFMARPRILNFSSKGNLYISPLVAVSTTDLSSSSYVLVHHKLAGSEAKSHFSASSIRSRSIFQIYFGVGHNPEVVGPHKAAYLMRLLSFEVQQETHV